MVKFLEENVRAECLKRKKDRKKEKITNERKRERNNERKKKQTNKVKECMCVRKKERSDKTTAVLTPGL